MLLKLKDFYFTTKPKLDDLVCDSKGWIKRYRGALWK